MTTITRLSINNDGYFNNTIGDNGLSTEQIEALSPKLDRLRDNIAEWQHRESINFVNLAFKNDLADIKKLGQECAQAFKHTVVLGIGGSSLGGEMLVKTLGRDQEAVTFCNNIDPASLTILNDVNWRDTLLLVISRSGNSPETLSQFLTTLPDMQRTLGEDGVRRHTIIITENEKGALFQLGKQLGVPIVPHPPVDGRFSVLSVVGLLPAYLAGVDIDALVDGAQAMTTQCSQESITENPAFFNGAAQYLHSEQGRTLSVLLPYADNLHAMMNWLRQLWAQNLGNINNDGINKGMTPVVSHGVSDQHSQISLYLHGPDDKQTTFFTKAGGHHLGARIPMTYQTIPAIAPLAGHTLGELFSAECRATRSRLSKHGRPNRTISLRDNDAFAIGELIVLMELETLVIAELMGLNPLERPSAEDSKTLTHEYLADFASLHIDT